MCKFFVFVFCSHAVVVVPKVFTGAADDVEKKETKQGKKIKSKEKKGKDAKKEKNKRKKKKKKKSTLSAIFFTMIAIHVSSCEARHPRPLPMRTNHRVQMSPCPRTMSCERLRLCLAFV